jgi:hypothetical protein
MQLIFYGVIAAALIILGFFTLKKNVRGGSVFKDTVDIINEIMKEPDDENDNAE